MTIAPPKFLIGQHPDRGPLWASIDFGARFIEGQVAERRFGAYVAPFRTEQDARDALSVAGAVNIEEERARRVGRRG